MTRVHQRLTTTNTTSMDRSSTDISQRHLSSAYSSQSTSLTVLVTVVSACVIFGLSLIVWFCCVALRQRRQQVKDSEYGRLVKSNNNASPNWSAVLHLQKNRSSELENERCIPFSVPMMTGSNSSLVQSSDSVQQQSRSSPSGSVQGASADDASSHSPRSSGGRGAAAAAALTWSSDSSAAEKRSEAAQGAISLGSIDPSLYRRRTDDCDDDDLDLDLPEGHIGRVRFSVQYNREAEKLTVTLMSARNLPSRLTASPNACDPFIRICLLPDTRSNVQSKFKKKTCNPKFEENFVFQVSVKNLNERVLKLTVYDIDRLRRHNVIGHVLYPLKEHDYEANERSVVTRDLELDVPQNALENKGELHIALSYNEHTARLTVGIFEGKDLKKYSDIVSPDYYVKVCLMRNSSAVKTRKTEVVKQDCNPKFNESFVFKLSSDSLDTASVSISAWNSLSGQRDKPIGRIVLGSFMFARGKELTHWNEAIGHTREQISHWHPLV